MSFFFIPLLLSICLSAGCHSDGQHNTHLSSTMDAVFSSKGAATSGSPSFPVLLSESRDNKYINNASVFLNKPPTVEFPAEFLPVMDFALVYVPVFVFFSPYSPAVFPEELPHVLFEVAEDYAPDVPIIPVYVLVSP